MSVAGPRGLRTPIDYLRKLLIVAALIGAILLLHQFAVPSGGFDPRGLLSLGFVVLAAYTVGELATVVGIPHITGYLLAGILFGPSVAQQLAAVLPVVHSLPPLDEGILSSRVLSQLNLVDGLALALIALTAGGELKLDELRRMFWQVLGSVWGMIFSVVPLVTIFVIAVAVARPAAMPVLAGLAPAPMLALAVVLAVLAAATSPAVSIAVITSTGARGPVATTVLTGVVFGEITVVLLFSATSSVALGLVGGTGAVSVLEALTRIGLSIAIGIGVGAAIALYLRYVAAEILLFLVGTIYATTFAIRELHGEAAVAFIAAGLVVGNFSGRGETLIREVERLSRPVFVVFFALAGAQLRLDVLGTLLLPALGLFLVRFAGVYFGARYGAWLMRAPTVVQAYGWMGFVSQAGLALALAGQARDVLPPAYAAPMYALTVSVIALCELVGPLILQTGLHRAGEIGKPADPASDPAPDPALPLATTRTPSPWEPRLAHSDDPWGLRFPAGGEALDRAVGELEIDLQALVQEHATAPLNQLRREAELWLRQLRRESLRTLRRAANRSGEPADVATPLRSDAADLAQQWRDLVRGRTLSDPWSPLGLVDALDAHVNRLPAAIEAGVVEGVLTSRPESVWKRIWRTFTRARNRLVPIRRSVDLHGLGRYHLSGLVPGRLEELAALVVRAELHVSDRLAGLLRGLAQEIERLARRAEDGDLVGVAAELAALRQKVDSDFEAATDELAAIAFDGASCATRIVGGAFRDLQRDATLVWTLDLPPGRRRFARVFEERSRGIAALTDGLVVARGLIRARHEQLALELELVGVEARVRSTVRRRATALARQVRARGPVQLEQVATLLGSLLQGIDDLLAAPPPAGVVSRHLRREIEPLLQRIHEARATVGSLVTDLSGEQWVSGLLEALDAVTQDLSESYTIPGPIDPVGAALPTVAPLQTIAFRELVAAFVESRVALGLVDQTHELLEQVRQMGAVLEEVERVAVFNVELSCAELDVMDEGQAASDETVDLVRAMVHGAIGRSHHRLVRQLEVAELTADQTAHRVHDNVLAQLGTLRDLLLAGRAAEIRTSWVRDGRALARRAESWRGWLPVVRERAEELSRRTLGPERLEAVRVALGIPPAVDRRDPLAAFPAPGPGVEVPAVYRRLFSDLPLESGDQLAGRDADLLRLRRGLTAGGPLRTAAVVGVDPPSGAALASAGIRGLFDGVVRIEPRSLADRVLVDGWLGRIGEVENHAIVIDNLHWLFERRPGGVEPLLRLVDGILADRGRNAWVLLADSAVWAWAATATPLGEVVGARVDLGPLSAEQLERAILSRHAMSGYGLEFVTSDDLGWRLQNLLSTSEDRERGRREGWFRTLHAASAGVLGDALRLWMASIRAVDDDAERVRIGAVPHPPLTRLAQLPDEVLVTLLETSRQGWMDEEQHRRLFRTGSSASEAHLASLAQMGLLVPEGEVLRIAAHLRGPLQRVLSWRRWL